jgi:eukaryotic-like serine/threonine-protein kinase
MSIIVPNDGDLQRALPQIQNIALLDTGGFKAVYRVTLGGRAEALKLIQIPASDGSTDAEAFKSEMIGRVRREVEALARCKGPEIVRLGTLPLTPLTISAADYVAYSEEFLEGSDLWKLLTSGAAKPTEQELRLLFATLLKAIREVWALGYVHRDIKPKNVMKLTNPARQFVLLDFGIAYSVQETGLTANATGRLPLATYRYLAPEMMNPAFRETIDYRTDLYTAAMTVYEYAAQAHPLAQGRDDLMRTISRALHQPAIPLTTHRNDLSPGFCQIIDQMLKKKPALRPANLIALIQRMESGT